MFGTKEGIHVTYDRIAVSYIEVLVVVSHVSYIEASVLVLRLSYIEALVVAIIYYDLTVGYIRKHRLSFTLLNVCQTYECLGSQVPQMQTKADSILCSCLILRR